MPRVLLATDSVAAELHAEDFSLVVNFNLPFSFAGYAKRVGVAPSRIIGGGRRKAFAVSLVIATDPSSRTNERPDPMARRAQTAGEEWEFSCIEVPFREEYGTAGISEMPMDFVRAVNDFARCDAVMSDE